MTRLVYLLALLSWIAADVWLLVDEHYQTFLRKEFSFLIGGGLVLLILMLLPVLFSRQWAARGQIYGKGLFIHVGVLMLPLIFLVYARGHTLGSYAYQKRTLSSTAPSTTANTETGPQGSVPRKGQSRQAETPRDDDGVLELSLADILKFSNLHEGRQVKTVGMLFQDPEFLPPGHIVLFRFMMVCCAADVRPVEVLVEVDHMARLENDTWVTVTGNLTVQEVDGASTPVLRHAVVRRTTEPQSPFLTY